MSCWREAWQVHTRYVAEHWIHAGALVGRTADGLY
jgi:hypothetical protein